MKTIYIKPPAETYAHDIVKYADVSLNSSYSTLVSLNEAAAEAGLVHKVIIMVELGELREGIKTNDIVDFYGKVFDMSNIEVIGIGSNLGCMYGVEPSYEKLLELSHLKSVISKTFEKDFNLISGGTSITLPLVDRNIVPKEINHFRIGEAAFFGKSPLKNEQFKDLHTDTFEFTANIIELEKKQIVPEGVISDANIGKAAEFDEKDIGESSYKAILDFGLLDIDKENINPIDESLTFVGITSDMLVVNLGKNRDHNGKKKYNIGDKVHFKANYMAVARLLNSKFIDKKYE